MTRIHTLLVSGAAAMVLAGCMHRGTQAEASGDVPIDSLSASRTAVLSVQNAYSSPVRIYTVIGGQLNYVAKAAPGGVHSWVLDPNLFPNSAISFEVRAADGGQTTRVGPFKVNKGETVDLIVPATLSETRATVHKSTS